MLTGLIICNVQQTSRQKVIMVMSDETDQFCVHSLHWHRAVQVSAAFLHLQRFTQPFLHLHESSSRQEWAASGRSPVWLVPSLPTLDPSPTGSWRQYQYREQHLSLNMTSLLCYPVYMFLQSSLGWRNMLYICFFAKGFLRAPVIDRNDKPLNGVQNISWYELRCR